MESGLKKAGFSPSEAVEWKNAGFSLSETIGWKNAGFKLEEAKQWKMKGYTPDKARKTETFIKVSFITVLIGLSVWLALSSGVKLLIQLLLVSLVYFWLSVPLLLLIYFIYKHFILSLLSRLGWK